MHEVVEGLFVPLDEVDERLHGPLRVDLADWGLRISLFVIENDERFRGSWGRDLLSSADSTVRMRSLMKFCISPNESAILAARYTCASGA